MKWKYKGFSDEKIKLLATSDNTFNRKLNYFNKTEFQLKFNEKCLSFI